MGMHTARRPRAATTLPVRGLFTATAALALVGGGAGMAFAGEPAHSGHESEHAEKPAACEIPVVDPTVAAGEAAINEATHDATAPAFAAGEQAAKPVHDAVCPPASELLGAASAGTPELPV
jgi:hypothetical protein